MPGSRTKSRSEGATAVEPAEFDETTVPDIGDAAAESYAAPPQEWPPDDRPPEEIAGTPEHLGTDDPYVTGTTPVGPYAGPQTGRDEAPPKP
jgi:hypothetical protein